MRLGFVMPFLGMPGFCNDMNVLQCSTLMTQIAMGEDPPVEFEANGHTYNYAYYLPKTSIQNGTHF
jgi:hypothetical protein